MGNVSSRRTNRVAVLQNVVSDISTNIVSSVIAEASQTIAVNQEQNVNLSNIRINGCGIKIVQRATIEANQTLSLKSFFSNPRKVVDALTKGSKSMLEQAMTSQSQVMKDFLASVKKNTNSNTDAQLKSNITNIMKTNINQSTIARANQNIFVNQTQNVNISGLTCTNGMIEITQELVLNAAQNVIVSVVQDSLFKDPKMRSALREFNGDYDQGYLDQDLDEGMNISDACIDKKDPVVIQGKCPPCVDCAPCEVSSVDEIVGTLDNMVFNAYLLYGAIGVAFFILALIALIK